jgi:hypothetical protein
MADKKVSELSAITNLSGDDLLLVVNDPSGTPTSNKVTVSNLFANVVPNVVHKGTVTTTANTLFGGTTMRITANATFLGTTTITGTVEDSRITDRMQVANTRVLHTSVSANLNSYVANTNSRLDTLEGVNNDQFASNTSLQSYIANTNAILDSGNFVHASFTITANGTSGYCFAGSGASNTNNETLFLYKGFTYRFVNTTTDAYPFQILNTAGGDIFANGVSGSQTGTQLFTVPHVQQSNLVYQSSNEAGMLGTLVIVS